MEWTRSLLLRCTQPSRKRNSGHRTAVLVRLLLERLAAAVVLVPVVVVEEEWEARKSRSALARFCDAFFFSSLFLFPPICFSFPLIPRLAESKPGCFDGPLAN